MKVVGLMCGWGCQDLIVPVINNHLKICDEIYVTIAPHHNKFEHMKDLTDTIAKQSFDKNYRVKFMNHSGYSGSCDSTKCSILMEQVKASSVEPGDILMICDVDEFYDDNAIKELKEKFQQNDWDRLQVTDRFYCVNRNWYVNSSGHFRFFKVTNGTHFVPTQKIRPESRKTEVVLKDNPMFHYSMLVGLEYKKIHWQTEGGSKPLKLRWLDEIFSKWNPEDKELCDQLAEKNFNMTGNRGYWVNKTGKGTNTSPYLHKFDGKHPVEIEETEMFL